ncbi:bifunctional C97 family peptidase/thioredoxin family protein [Aspergillus stella-maris]|uniref:bifunctional C97 family peptidase/thioredoxin family protein n=1 Tax=Aspergillus stella-maris TaxID=1810926 RepID=UPI003CCE31E0
MDVELYVYDLSQGLARMYSMALTGTQIDAIYHTSLVFNNIEYYFGQGIQTSYPGATHHGQPMEKIHMGKSELPAEVMEEYLQSLSSIYTPESYDLFLHNCNNFTQDLAMFLVGKSIPEHIRNLPSTFLATPLGQMLKPQIEGALRGVTQAPAPGLPGPSMPAAQPQVQRKPHVQAQQPQHKVQVVTSSSELDKQLASALNSCAVIFFTSSTCPPCKVMYPVYDELAEEAGPRAVLIKVDTGVAMEVGVRYSVRATPTFMTFLRGEKLDTWSGADAGQLRGNVRLLLEMAHPAHKHRKMNLPSLQRTIGDYVTYKKSPPLEKLILKLKPHESDPTLLSMLDFIKKRSQSASTADTALPSDLPSYAPYIVKTYNDLPIENHFALVDLVRLLFVDPRVAAYIAEDSNHALLSTLFSLADDESTPYPLRIVTLQLACNLFSTPLYRTHLSSPSSTLRPLILNLCTSSLLSPQSALRVVAASLAYNLSALTHNVRFNPSASSSPSNTVEEPLGEEDQVALTASIVEALGQESSSAEAIHGLVYALGLLVYEASDDGAVIDLCRALDAKSTFEDVKGRGVQGVKEDKVVKEVGELLAKGL